MEDIKRIDIMEVSKRTKGFLGLFKEDYIDKRQVRVIFNRCFEFDKHSIPVTHFYIFESEEDAKAFKNNPSEENGKKAIHVEKVGK